MTTEPENTNTSDSPSDSSSEVPDVEQTRERAPNEQLVERALWKTQRNQDRLILRVKGTQVIYATRGGNALGPFGTGATQDPDVFVAEGAFHSLVSDEVFAQANATLSNWLSSLR
jgi:hypothetical protein